MHVSELPVFFPAFKVLYFVQSGDPCGMSTRACCWRPGPTSLAGAHFQTGDMYVADETYSGVRPMAVSSEGISFVKNMMVPTSDGTKLAMDVHVPPGEGPWPVILTYIPVPQG